MQENKPTVACTVAIKVQNVFSNFQNPHLIHQAMHNLRDVICV